MSSTTMRVFEFTKEAVDKYLKRVNIKRNKLGLRNLTKSDVLAIAVNNLTDEAGMTAREATK